MDGAKVDDGAGEGVGEGLGEVVNAGTVFLFKTKYVVPPIAKAPTIIKIIMIGAMPALSEIERPCDFFIQNYYTKNRPYFKTKPVRKLA